MDVISVTINTVKNIQFVEAHNTLCSLKRRSGLEYQPPYIWRCFASEGSRLPSVWAHFSSWFLLILALVVLVFCLNIYKYIYINPLNPGVHVASLQSIYQHIFLHIKVVIMNAFEITPVDIYSSIHIFP